MNKAQSYLHWLIIFLISAEVSMQVCYKQCNCLKKKLTLNKCTPHITHLNIEFRSKDMFISCKKSISEISDDLPTFDAKYLTTLDDNSTIALPSMLKKCYKSNVREFKYTLDWDKMNNITASKNMLGRNNNITYLKFENNFPDNRDLENVTLLETDFLAYGIHLNALIINNLRIRYLKNYFQYSPKIEILDLASNHIRAMEESLFENFENLRHLNLRDNKINVLNEQIFQRLDNLSSLDLSLNEINYLKKGMFDSMENLRFLNLSKNTLDAIDDDTFSSLTKLEVLDLSENRNLNLNQDVFRNLTSLKSLNLSGCYLTSIPTKFLHKSQALDVLNISRNSIEKLENNSFANLTNLKIIDLSYNTLQTLPKNVLQPLKNLQQIFLNYNRLTVFDTEVFWNIHSLNTIDLSNNMIRYFNNPLGRFKTYKIVLRNNKIDKFPAFMRYIVGLRFLDLSFNTISSVELVKELIPDTCNMEIDLSNNQISQLNITNLGNKIAKTSNSNWKVMLDLSRNRLKCNCLHYQINLKSSAVGTTILQLDSKENICYDEYPNYNCPLINIKNCPHPCNCYYTRPDNAITVDCSFRNLTTFPKVWKLTTDRYEHNQTYVKLNGNKLNVDGQERMKMYTNVTKLDLSNNWIGHLNALPENVKTLNLENNYLKYMSQEIVESLKKNKALEKLWLRNNTWECSCNAVYLKNYLIEVNNFKTNQSEVICESSGESLLLTKICETPVTLKIAIPLGLTITLAFVCAMFALYFKYNTRIKIYLFSKNMCLWCVAEEELDKDKIFDVFISYSHKDELFVNNELLPELLNGDKPFKICIHYKDFKPGEFISKQIVDSVLNSRRTLVVLSNNFMESVWGKMEFRTAHTQAITEGRARVIVVLYGELDENILDDEMKTYLKTNTYVKWGDQWFWSKLKYALPHSRIKNQTITFTNGGESIQLK